MAYTTINKFTDHFNTILYTGDGNSTKALTGVGFQPDWVWIKNRTDGHWHNLTDAVRGTAKTLIANNDSSELSNATSGYVSTFGTDGFTVTGGSSNKEEVNTSSDNYVAWNWKAGGGQGSSNTDGSINTTYTSVNTTAGFSISTYTGNGTSGATVGHGLGSVPKFVMVKTRSGTGNWINYHSSVGNTKYLSLNQTNSAGTTNQAWNDTSPTNQVFSLGNSSEVNGNGTTMIAYCFAEKKGYSKFGGYTGNGNADGTFIYTGFKPAFIMVKRTDSANNWTMYDNKRNTSFNEITHTLIANSNDAEATSTSDDDCDFLSNGVKMRCSNNGSNGSGASYIYMAFGQSMVGSNNVPATAR